MVVLYRPHLEKETLVSASTPCQMNIKYIMYYKKGKQIGSHLGRRIAVQILTVPSKQPVFQRSKGPLWSVGDPDRQLGMFDHRWRRAWSDTERRESDGNTTCGFSAVEGKGRRKNPQTYGQLECLLLFKAKPWQHRAEKRAHRLQHCSTSNGIPCVVNVMREWCIAVVALQNSTWQLVAVGWIQCLYPKCHTVAYIAHYWSKAVYYIGNRVPCGIHTQCAEHPCDRVEELEPIPKTTWPGVKWWIWLFRKSRMPVESLMVFTRGLHHPAKPCYPGDGNKQQQTEFCLTDLLSSFLKTLSFALAQNAASHDAKCSILTAFLYFESYISWKLDCWHAKRSGTISTMD